MADPIIHYTFDTDGTNSGSLGTSGNSLTAPNVSTAVKHIGSGSLLTTNVVVADAPKFTFTSKDTEGITISFWTKLEGSMSNGYYWYSCHPATSLSTQTNDFNNLDAFIGRGNNTLRLYTLDPVSGVGNHPDNKGGTVDTITADENPLTDGNWHHIAISYGKAIDTDINGTDYRVRSTVVYIDSIAVCNADWGGGFPNNQENVVIIGGSWEVYNTPIPGNIDDFRMYNYDLTHSEILNIFLLGLPNLTHTEILELYGVTVTDADLINMRIQIKIHENFTISDGTSSSAFTTGDADYTPITFANKLSTALTDNTVTFGATGGSGYLEFANSATLTGMPNYIFAIPSSDFFVKAGGRVNFRNVHLDAEMTIVTNRTAVLPFEYMTVVSMQGSTEDTGKDIDVNNAVFDRYTNKLYDPDFFGSSQFAEVAFSQTSIFVVSTGSSSHINKVFELDENEPYGMKQLGGNLNAWTDELVISGDGLTVAMTYAAAGGQQGLMSVYRRNLNEANGWESINELVGGDLTGPTGTNKQFYASLSGDGNIIALGCYQNLNKVRVFEYSGSGKSWTQLGTDITVPGTKNPVKISKDGNILCVMSVSAKSVSVYERDTNAASGWSQIGSTIPNLEEKIALNKNGDIFASFKTQAVISVYKRDTNDASGWSLMADITKNGYAVRTHTDNTLSLDDDGHTLICGAPQDGDWGNRQGTLYLFKYNTTTSTWGPIVTNNINYSPMFPQNVNNIVEGGTKAILGENHYSPSTTYANLMFAKFSTISGDGKYVIATNINNVAFMYIYKLPGEEERNRALTIPSGDSFINNFVGSIETEHELTVSYDADNKQITFDGITGDIEVSITSTDTTVFDTSITEITVAENTLPFITYGEPEPNYSQNGIFYITIKIHENFTISDGTNSSAFTTGDADYTPSTFASKLTTDLASNTVTFDAIRGSGYLEFANAATLTGMPKYIFNIPFSDFSVKAGGRVNLRNVNLDAEMTIDTAYENIYTLGRLGADIDGIGANTRSGTSLSLSRDGSIVAIGAYKYNNEIGVTQIYKYSTPLQSGGTWQQIGADIVGISAGERFGSIVSLSSDGNIVAISATMHDGKGTVRVYKNVSGTWTKLGSDIDGISANSNSGRGLSLSGDGIVVAIGAPYHAGTTGAVSIYKYSTPGIIGGTWQQLGADMIGVANDLFGFCVALSRDDSSIVGISALGRTNYAGTAMIYKYSTPGQLGGTWQQLGEDLDGAGANSYFGAEIAMSSDGSIIVGGAWKYGGEMGTSIVYKYSTPGLIGGEWQKLGASLDGEVAGERAGFSVSSNDDGDIIAIGAYKYDNSKGRVYIYKYSTPGLIGGTWTKLVTEIEDGVNANDQTGYKVVLNGSGYILANSAPDYGNGPTRVHRFPYVDNPSNTSTLPANNYFINNFVSTIETDLVNYTLSYDASNALITFDGLAQDISMSITSTDTTVFDTSITEITAIEKTLPFITYGEPETSYFQYSLNGITYDEFIASGITSTEVISQGVIPGWSTETDANQFDKSYVLGFMDVSGYMAIRNDYDMLVMGNSTIDGTINMQEDKTLSSSILSVDSRLFANGDISANGKLYVGSDLSVNGQFSSNFAGNSIPYSKIKDSPIITGNVKIGEDVSFNGPTVELGSGATLKLSGTTEFNDNTVFDVNSIRFSGTIVSGNMVFKDTTITDVVVNGSATATTVTSSDYRIKSNVTELNETHTVDKLEPIYYENTLTGNHEYGLIAHELQAEYPDLVINEKDGDEYQSVHYDGLIGVLVKEIQDLKKRLNVLNNT